MGNPYSIHSITFTQHTLILIVHLLYTGQDIKMDKRITSSRNLNSSGQDKI